MITLKEGVGMADKQCEGPVPDYNGSSAPGGAMKMPVKHYPMSQPDKGKSTTVEGPCSEKGPYHR